MEIPWKSLTLGIVESSSRSQLEFEICSYLPQYKLSSAIYISYGNDRELWLSRLVHLLKIYKTYEYRHA